MKMPEWMKRFLKPATVEREKLIDIHTDMMMKEIEQRQEEAAQRLQAQVEAYKKARGKRGR